MDGDKNDDEDMGFWISTLSAEELDRLDGLDRARRTRTEHSKVQDYSKNRARRAKTENCSKDKPQKVDSDFLHYLFCKGKLSGKKMVRWADFEDWHKKMSLVKPELIFKAETC